MNVLRRAVVASLAAAILCLGSAGMAQDRDSGLYAAFSGLLVVPQDSELSGPAEDSTLTLEFSTNTGFGVLAAAGYRLPSGLRAELELGYRGFDFDKVSRVAIETEDASGSSDVNIPISGDFRTISFMANGIYSLTLSGFRPYAGLGVGLASTTLKIDPFTFKDLDDADAAYAGGEETKTVLAYQGMAGIGYQLSDRSEAWLGYRYFGTGNLDFGEGVEATYATHNFEIGLLYRF